MISPIVQKYVEKLEAISQEMADGTITSEEGKKRSAELRAQNPRLHQLAMRAIGELYGFAKEYDEEEKAKKKAERKKTWRERMKLISNKDLIKEPEQNTGETWENDTTTSS